jgi:aspartate racemase
VRRIGILAHSPEGSALAYLTACHEGARVLGAHLHPPLVMDFEAMGHSLPDWEAMRLAPIRARLAEGIARLKSAGADFFFCPDNTAHLALENPGWPFVLPGVHIAEVTAHAAVHAGVRRVALLGTKWTMTGPIYPRMLGAMGVATVLPTPEEMDAIQAAIFDELCQGNLTGRAPDLFRDVIARMARTGCDGAILGCTEIPLVVPEGTAPVPTFDTTRLIAKAAVAAALGYAPFPAWTGGLPTPHRSSGGSTP